MQIPVDQLDEATLTRVVEEFISREGTDYGMHSPDLLVKVQAVLHKLKTGAAVLCFDEVSETCQILSREAFRAFQKAGPPPERPVSNDFGVDF